jgi:hypothetical protein
MPVPTSNQGAESKRWLVPLLANSATQHSAVHARVAQVLGAREGQSRHGQRMVPPVDQVAHLAASSSAFVASAPRPSRAPLRGSLRSALSGRP